MAIREQANDTLWTNHDEEHFQVLLKFAKEQRTLHLEEALAAETETYRTWMSKATEKGCRGLYRTLTRDEMPYMRPFQGQPRTERMEMRLQQWGAIWRLQEPPSHLKLCHTFKRRPQALDRHPCMENDQAAGTESTWFGWCWFRLGPCLSSFSMKLKLKPPSPINGLSR